MGVIVKSLVLRFANITIIRANILPKLYKKAAGCRKNFLKNYCRIQSEFVIFAVETVKNSETA